LAFTQNFSEMNGIEWDGQPGYNQAYTWKYKIDALTWNTTEKITARTDSMKETMNDIHTLASKLSEMAKMERSETAKG
jgi:hypothetical protein